MLHVCPSCGKYSEDLYFFEDENAAVCPVCGACLPIRRYPLFWITGASCAGKSTVSRELFLQDNGLIVLESDILWDDKWEAMGDNYRTYRRTWLRVCQNVCQQAGKPVVLCGCCEPSQFAGLSETGFFTGIHFLAVVCRDEALERRMDRRGTTDPGVRRTHRDFNRWFYENHSNTDPPITLLDTSDLTPAKAAEQALAWCREILAKENPYER